MSNQSTEQPEELPVHDGDTPPEGQVRGMATPEDLKSSSEEDGNA
ncbi:hypothetical protein [Streptomyces nigrescens]